jgi:hypothetical protein
MTTPSLTVTPSSVNFNPYKMKIDHIAHFWAGMAILAVTGSWPLLIAAAFGRELKGILLDKRTDYDDSVWDVVYTLAGGLAAMLAQFLFAL